MLLFVPIYNIQTLLINLLSIAMILIFVEILVSNLICFGVKISHRSPFVKTLRSIVYPLVNPIRKIMPPPSRTGNLDFAPMIVLFSLQAVRNALL